MATLSTDQIVPRHSNKITLEHATCSDPTQSHDIVNLRTLQSYIIDPMVHLYTAGSVSIELVGADASGATMTGVIQIVGDVVTLAWNNLTFTSGGSSLSNSTYDLGPYTPRTMASVNVSYLRAGNVQNGRIAISPAGTIVSIYGSESLDVFGAGEVRLYSSSISWPYYNPV